jgi:hypothetical protein
MRSAPFATWALIVRFVLSFPKVFELIQKHGSADNKRELRPAGALRAVLRCIDSSDLDTKRFALAALINLSSDGLYLYLVFAFLRILIRIGQRHAPVRLAN